MAYKALVIGASGAIGNAFCKVFEGDAECTWVAKLARATHTNFDLDSPESFADLAASFKEQGPFDWIVDATGALTIDGVGPEKHLGALTAERLSRSFAVNAIAPALLIRHFAPLLASGQSVYAKLSARVGSIADNQKGGWYGYRASKAALNMMLQTAAIELHRKNPAMLVIALQPGTVASKLSQPFAADPSHLLTPESSAAQMLNAMRLLQEKEKKEGAISGAYFIDYGGDSIPW